MAALIPLPPPSVPARVGSCDLSLCQAAAPPPGSAAARPAWRSRFHPPTLRSGRRRGLSGAPYFPRRNSAPHERVLAVAARPATAAETRTRRIDHARVSPPVHSRVPPARSPSRLVYTGGERPIARSRLGFPCDLASLSQRSRVWRGSGAAVEASVTCTAPPFEAVRPIFLRLHGCILLMGLYICART